MDFILHMSNEILAVAICDTYSPASIRARAHWHPIVEFQVERLNPLQLIRLEGAGNTIFDKLEHIVMDEFHQLGDCLDRVSHSSVHTKDEIKEMIQMSINDLKDQFNAADTYPEKNKMLLQLADFYREIRND
jgi:hypothetical protein